MELGLILIFWYGILHAFGPDHIVAIVNFSLGKSKSKTLLITISFAIGHGLMLFIFAKILQSYTSIEEYLAYGDYISTFVIIAMGIYMIYLVTAKRIILEKHVHKGHEHIHLSFQKNHTHKSNETKNAFMMGSLMGIGGVRGMLITLSVISSASVNLYMVIAFILGVSLVFVGFGLIINFINENILNSKRNIKRVFILTGIISILVGLNIVFI
ncbi:hypothetical protein [Poseidonibacter antarcticus]|uniref:hypothetical protein n=1 Tax=Poseidonibacter antarcticus TaxID=2478538 RepID=UPI000EF5243A|nr:hypothetical protein [Poseidonibacter antarcticus]